MRLSDSSKVITLLAARKNLIENRNSAEGSGLGVTLGGTYQKNDIVDQVRPFVRAVIDGKIDLVDTELRTLGVVIDE